MDSVAPLIDEEPRDPQEIERGAVRGISYMTARTLGLQAATAVATIALVRILSPEDYGAFAVAQSLQLVGRSAVELGIPLALVRREKAPTLEEERALTGLMLTIGSALALAALALGYLILPAIGVESRIAQLTAIASCSLPIYGIRAVPIVQLERRLRFGRLIAIEIAETFAFYAFALPAAIAGLGALSLVAALPVSALVGVVAAMWLQPWRFGARLDNRTLRPLFGFGVQTGLLVNVNLAREMGFTATLAAVGGEALAGFYGLSQRIFSIPLALMYALSRVAVSSLARSEAGAERARLAARAVGVSALALSLPLALIVGAADPLIVVLFGDRWLPTAEIVVYMAAGILLVAGVGTNLTGLFLADGDARSPLLAYAAGGLVSVTLAVLLADPLGTSGAGIAGGCGFTVVAVLMILRSGWGLRREMIEAVARALAVAAIAAAAGALSAGSDSVRDLVVALAVSSAVWAALALILARAQLFTLIRLLRQHALK